MRWLLPFLAASTLGAQQYFPVGVLQGDAGYSKYLQALREPSLWELAQRDPDAEVYRFLWLRSFHNQISIRVVVHANGTGWIYARMTSRRGSEPGGIRRYSTSWLRKARTGEWLRTFDASGFWDQPPSLPLPASVVQVDGAQWVLEGIRKGQYHVVDRWSPPSGDPDRTIGILALKLARFRVRAADIY
jgi:hypothetical protein